MYRYRIYAMMDPYVNMVEDAVMATHNAIMDIRNWMYGYPQL